MKKPFETHEACRDGAQSPGGMIGYGKRRDDLSTGFLRQNAESIARRLVENAGAIKFGSVAVTLKVHNGQIVNIMNSTTENTKGCGEAVL